MVHNSSSFPFRKKNHTSYVLYSPTGGTFFSYQKFCKMKFSDKSQNHSVNRIMQFSSIMIFFFFLTKTLWIGEKRHEQGSSQFSYKHGQINCFYKIFASLVYFSKFCNNIIILCGMKIPKLLNMSENIIG